MKMMILTILMILLGSPVIALSQVVALQDQPVFNKSSSSESVITIKDAMSIIEENENLFFIFSHELIDLERQINLSFNRLTLKSLLDELNANNGIKYMTIKNKVILYSNSDFNKTASRNRGVSYEIIQDYNGERVISNREGNQSDLQDQTVRGRVIDDSGDPVIGATIILKNTPSIGTSTDMQGNFELSGIPSGTHTLVFRSVGFVALEREFELTGTEPHHLGDFQLESSTIALSDIEVLASTAIDRRTPVAFSSVESQYIDTRMGTQEFPELLKHTPGVFTTKLGGGYGDARINIRGFEQNNTAVLINGIPVNDPENGWVFWSNWVGLGDVTRTIQVQRGLGASRLAINSIGGTINIITKTTDMERGGSVESTIGPSGYLKTAATVSSGLTDDGWAFTFSGSRTTGDGYVDATYIDAWSYFLSVSKQLNPDHLLVFTGFGAPQRHGQRQTRETIETFNDHHRGIRYNSQWGYLDGERVNVENNRFHKPQLALNHYWSINDNNDLTTSVYYSSGEGYGSGPFGTVNISRLSNGQIDFDSIRDFNRGRIPDEEGNFNQPDDDGLYPSQYIHVNFTNQQYWFGGITNLNSRLTEDLNLTAGADVRFFKSRQDSRVRNLFGGDYTVNFFDVNNPNVQARTGDQFFYDNDNFINWYGLFGQLEYTFDPFNVFIGGTISNTAMKRVDRYNYLNDDPMQETDWENFMGYNLKAGINYNITENHNVFGNTGIYSRAPFFRDVFVNFRNEVATEINNEGVYAFELGYGYRSRSFALNLNVYNTIWRDKSFQVGVTEPDGTTSFANIAGLDALHRGVELDFTANLGSRITVTGMASIGDWKWQNDVEAQYANQDQSEITQVQIFADGLHVGDAAQTSFALSADYQFTDDLNIGVTFMHFDRIFAQFDPVGRNDPDNRQDSWQLPSYSLVDLFIGYNFEIAGLDAQATLNVYNLFNNKYITDALDGSNHSRDTARVFYGFERNAAGGLKVNF